MNIQNKIQQEVESFDTLWEFCTSNNRVCPMPPEWNDLYQILNNTKRVGTGYELPAPLILGAWGNTSNIEKQERLKIHIKWAEKQNQIKEVGKYLRKLPEDKWVHFG